MIGLRDTTEALEIIQDWVFACIDQSTRLTFEPMSARDVSGQWDKSLFDQNEDFVMFDSEIDMTGRAGPSQASPGRAYGSLTISWYTKDMDADLAHRRQLEVFSAWFAEKTIEGVRFRTFTPLGAARVMGFLTYSGVMSFDFETQSKGVPL